MNLWRRGVSQEEQRACFLRNIKEETIFLGLMHFLSVLLEEKESSGQVLVHCWRYMKNGTIYPQVWITQDGILFHLVIVDRAEQYNFKRERG